MKEIIGYTFLILFGAFVSNRDRIQFWLTKKIRKTGVKITALTGGKDA